jgi:hypothetical protein
MRHRDQVKEAKQRLKERPTPETKWGFEHKNITHLYVSEAARNRNLNKYIDKINESQIKQIKIINP